VTRETYTHRNKVVLHKLLNTEFHYSIVNIIQWWENGLPVSYPTHYDTYLFTYRLCHVMRVASTNVIFSGRWADDISELCRWWI